MANQLIYAQQNDNLDAIAYRHFANQSGALEKLLALNPTLASQPILAIGTPVLLPSAQDIAPTTDKTLIQLWD